MMLVGLAGLLAGLLLGAACLTWWDLRRLDSAVSQLLARWRGGAGDPTRREES
jgi:hypothetical protein